MVLASERRRLVELLHSTHLSDRTMLETARRIWYWAGMKKQVTAMYRNCEACQVQSPAKPRQVPVLPDDIVVMSVMELVGVDLMQVGGKSYLVMVDKKSGFRFCTNLPKTSTRDVIQALEHWFHQYGFPSRLRTDGGPQFRQEFGRWCK